MQIHVPMINKKVGQIISINGDTVQVMDSETFETIDVSMILLLNKQQILSDRMTKIFRIKN